MSSYIIRRVLWGIGLLILVTALTFLLFSVLPAADPVALRAGSHPSPATVARVRADLDAGKPLYTQFWVYMRNVFLHLNFGYSYVSGASVLSVIGGGVPATLSLMLGAIALWL